MNILAFVIIACLFGGCATRSQDIAHYNQKVYSGPCWMDPDTTGP